MVTEFKYDLPGSNRVVHVVEDDADCGESIRLLLARSGLATIVYDSAEQFLKSYDDSEQVASCLLLDLQLRGMSGMALLQNLTARGIRIPVIFLSGQADVSTAVAAMKLGAVDFLEKPLDSQSLLEGVQQAVVRDARYRYDRAHRDRSRDQLRALSKREREVAELVVLGQSAKQIANKLGICPKTAMKHRHRICEKLGAEGVVQLVEIMRGLRDDQPP